jgi:putative DNA methylase
MASIGSGPRKLIEVALPLKVINEEAAREKSIRHGHPSTLHLWWARRPLAACRAVLFAQLVDDPSAHPELFPTEEAQRVERERLFRLIERLVPWEASNDEAVLAEAREEIRRSCGDELPVVLDPFCGGGSIPLEAQRLGLVAHASDLNPVAVLITKALIELPARFAARPPVHPQEGEGRLDLGVWKGARGLAEDVRYYGAWMHDEAERRIGHLYPPVVLPDGGTATVIAWIWAHTVTCPNPACRATMPLIRSFWLGKKKSREAWVRPVVEGKAVRFEIEHGRSGPPLEGTVGRNGANCLVCSSPVPLAHLRTEGKAGRMGAQLMAIVAEGDRQRLYLPPDVEHQRAADIPRPVNPPDAEVTTPSHDVDRLPMYGMRRWSDAFTSRQLTALCTFSDLIGAARQQIISGGAEPAYADTVITYLALAVDRIASTNSALSRWRPDAGKESVNDTFSRQALSMVWDFAEGRPFTDGPCSYKWSVGWVARVLDHLPQGRDGVVTQEDAMTSGSEPSVICTDPPYYDNIGYADLSDFFYVWLRRSLVQVFPSLFSTVLTPKSMELIASPYRHGGSKSKAKQFFEAGFQQAFSRLQECSDGAFPLTVFYAFKQAEDDADGVASTGWETMLTGLLGAGFVITATWPIRTELGNRMLSSGTNALASSVVLACRPRREAAEITDRRGFLVALREQLPRALRELQEGSIAPVDLAQAAIGPGMAVFSRYTRVVESDGSSMRVRTALGLINQALDDVLAEQEGEFDADTRWAIAWFEQNGFDPGRFGDAETLSKAKVTSLSRLAEAGIVAARAGVVRLLRREELDVSRQPDLGHASVWAVTQRLIRALETESEEASARLLVEAGGQAAAVRDLAYRLFVSAERRGWAADALSFNALVAAWPELTRLAGAKRGPVQETML